MECRDGCSVAPFSRNAREASAERRGFFSVCIDLNYFISAMHFFTKAAFWSIGMFSSIARSSHARIFLVSLWRSIFSGAVDFISPASAGADNQIEHKSKPKMTTIEQRMMAP